MTTTATAQTTTNNETTKCLCGCGVTVNKAYRPGHDARHAGQVARYAADLLLNTHIEDYTDFIENYVTTQLPTFALRQKALNHFIRLVNNPTKDVREPGRDYSEEAGHLEALEDALNGIYSFNDYAPTTVTGTVKVGRWDYPAINKNGEVTRNEKRDGSGVWIPAHLKDFTPNA